LFWGGAGWIEATPASASAVSTALYTPTETPGEPTGAHVTVTPKVSGTFIIAVNAVVENSDSTGTSHAAIVGFAHGPSSTASPDFAYPFVPSAALPPLGVGVGNITVGPIRTDSLPTPIGPFPLGTPVTFFVSVTAGDTSGDLTVPAEGCQITVTEVLA
jgi:hypothetical protein